MGRHLTQVAPSQSPCRRTLHLTFCGQLISLGCPGLAACRSAGGRSFHSALGVLMDPRPGEGPVTRMAGRSWKSLVAFDLTGCAHSAARLAGCDPKAVRHWVAQRDRGLPVGGPGRRERLIDPFLDKAEEWVDRSKVRSARTWCTCGWSRSGSTAMSGPPGVRSPRPRRGSGRAPAHLPSWITEPGMWCQFDCGVGPAVSWAGGPPRATLLFCLWLAWSRFRVVIPTWDRTLPTPVTA